MPPRHHCAECTRLVSEWEFSKYNGYVRLSFYFDITARRYCIVILVDVVLSYMPHAMMHHSLACWFGAMHSYGFGSGDDDNDDDGDYESEITIAIWFDYANEMIWVFLQYNKKTRCCIR